MTEITPMTDSRIDPAALDALLEPFDSTNSPGFAVGVALRGRPVYRRGVGMASIELPVALSPGIRMRIGSTSKHFTTLAVMLLAEEGRLSIEDSPRRLLPELPHWAEAMSIRHLMAHTSGMRDSLDLILHSAGPGIAAAPDFQLRLLAGLDGVNFAPGTSWSYNNGGYVLLAQIVERASGLTFAGFLRERIFLPVGMNDTLLRALDTDLVPNSATLHVPCAAGGYMRGVFGVPIGGEGGIVSTVDDMLVWLAHMSDPVVGTKETWAAMHTPMATHGYGLGLTMDGHRGLDTVHHAGAVVGGSCQMLKVLGTELDIIVMTNGLGSLATHTLVEDIIDRCLPDLSPRPENVVAPPLQGAFYSAITGRKLALEDMDGRQAIRIDGTTLPAHRDAEGRLTLPLVPSDLVVSPSADGALLELNEFGRNDTLLRIVPPQNADINAIVGRYENAAADLVAAIAADNTGAATLTLAGPLGATDYELAAIGPALWEGRATGVLSLAVLLEVGDGHFALTSGRTRRLAFERAS
jgi:CubicO group peptidase (beta-lactamase class C family)